VSEHLAGIGELQLGDPEVASEPDTPPTNTNA
jgi:hypothetical protein